MTSTSTLDQPAPLGGGDAPQGGFEIDPGLDVVTTRETAASAILKFHRSSSLDYRARQGPLVIWQQNKPY